VEGIFLPASEALQRGGWVVPPPGAAGPKASASDCTRLPLRDSRPAGRRATGRVGVSKGGGKMHTTKVLDGLVRISPSSIPCQTPYWASGPFGFVEKSLLARAPEVVYSPMWHCFRMALRTRYPLTFRLGTGPARTRAVSCVAQPFGTRLGSDWGQSCSWWGLRPRRGRRRPVARIMSSGMRNSRLGRRWSCSNDRASCQWRPSSHLGRPAILSHPAREGCAREGRPSP
jgi:hypothetical protein